MKNGIRGSSSTKPNGNPPTWNQDFLTTKQQDEPRVILSHTYARQLDLSHIEVHYHRTALMMHSRFPGLYFAVLRNDGIRNKAGSVTTPGLVSFCVYSHLDATVNFQARKTHMYAIHLFEIV